MGVKACDRNGCYEIMCDTCIQGEWYICPSCEREFRIGMDDEMQSAEDWMKNFEEFMETDKNYSPSELIDIDEFLNS